MTPSELEGLEIADDRDRQWGFVCAVCQWRATCPMLRDEIWNLIKPEPVRVKVPGPRRDYPEHRPTVTATRCLLCTRCAEARLGRQLTVDDLAVCVGNYGAATMLRRERALLDEALDLLEQVDDFIDTSESEVAARIAKAAGR